jgi:hypothetical protein
MIIEDVAKVGIIVHAPSGEILISQVPAFGAVGGNKKQNTKSKTVEEVIWRTIRG